MDPDEEKQMRMEQMSDHLIERDDYFNLNDPSVFLEWGYENMSDFYDAHTEDLAWVEDFNIDGLFDRWLDTVYKVAA
jgi:hypothetical protein